MGPLNGVKVLDLSRILAGPWASQVLADFGATVWKIEHPEKGDDTRRWGPPYLNDDKDCASAYFLSANRGKHSVAIDITSKSGQNIIRQLAKQADVVIENFKVGGLSKYQLDYENLIKVNPALIYCSVTGFGQTGPDAKKAGYDAMIQATGGLMSITGEADHMPGGGPQKVGVAVADLMTGMYAVTGILAALFHRCKTGRGQYIDLALLDTQVAWLANQGLNYLVNDESPERLGTAHPNIVPYQVFRTLDSHIMLAVGNDEQFKRCCHALGQEELASNANYLTNELRVKNRSELVKKLQHIFEQKTTEELLTLFHRVTVPCGPINNISQVFSLPQVKHREMQFSLSHEKQGEVPQVANPIKFSDSQLKYKKAPPMLGEDTKQVLQQVIGIPAEQIKQLRKAGVIYYPA